MNTLFLRLLNAGITAGWLILAVIVARLLLKKAPRRAVCALWAIVALRLLLPIDIQSPLSLLPASTALSVREEVTAPTDSSPSDVSLPSSQNPWQDSAPLSSGDTIASVSTPAGDTASRENVSDGYPETTYSKTNTEDNASHAPADDVPAAATESSPALANGNANAGNAADAAGGAGAFAFSSATVRSLTFLWIAGMFVFAGLALFSFTKLRGMTAASVRIADRGSEDADGTKAGRIFACDEISSPFILGILRPGIFVPSGLRGQEYDYVIAHEKAHLARHDHWWKPLAYLLLALYWFQPLCWIAFWLFCRDVEMACDEQVVHNMERAEIAEYSQTLLNLSNPHRTVAVCPLAFGMVSVKQRIRNVLSYKKAPFWIIVMVLLTGITVAILFGTGPRKAVSPDVTATPTSGEAPQGEAATDSSNSIQNPGKAVDAMCPEFTAKVTQINADSVLVYAGSVPQLERYYLIEIPKSALPSSPEVRIGDRLDVRFNGIIIEGMPAHLQQINSVRVRLEPSTTSVTLEELREYYPEVFRLGRSDGVTIAVWQLGAGSYYCTFFSGTTISAAEMSQEILSRPQLRVDTAKMILESFHLPDDKIRIEPVYALHSSYAYIIDDAYRAGVRAMFVGSGDIRSGVAYTKRITSHSKEEFLSQAVDYELYESSQMDSWRRILPVFCLDSDEAVSSFALTDSPATRNINGKSFPSFRRAVSDRRFTGSFYDDSVLLAVMIPMGMEYRVKLDSILYDNDTLCLNLKRTDTSLVPSDSAYTWFMLVAVPRSYVEGRTEIYADLLPDG